MRYSGARRGAHRRALIAIALAAALAASGAVGSIAHASRRGERSSAGMLMVEGMGPHELLGPAAPPAPPAGPYEWAERYDLIAHAMGAVGGVTLTNTREAFERNYARGYRVFEVDFSLTRDRAFVARHDWSAERFERFRQRVPEAVVPTLAEFEAARVRGKYTPLTAAGVVELMRRFPDAYVMTDVKAGSVKTRARALRTLLDAAGPDRDSVRRRLIVQIYTEADLAPVRKLGIENVVYTFYHLETSMRRAMRFAVRNGIRVVAVPESRATGELVAMIRARGLICAAHTVNSPREARALRKRGVALLYSDGLPPDPSAR